jgi:hypothetical protein
MPVHIQQSNGYQSILIGGKNLLHIEAYSIGYPPRNRYFFGVRINGQVVHQAGRGWGISVISPAGQLIAAASFDTLGAADGTTATAAANYFSSYNKDQNVICVHTQDEPVFYSNNFKNYLAGSAVGFKTIFLANAYRGAWCGIYQHSKGPLAEEATAIWAGSAFRPPQGDNSNSNCGCHSTIVI